MCFDNKKVDVTISVTKYGRKELNINYGKEKTNVVDEWSYQNTSGSLKELKNEKKDTLSKYIFMQAKPMAGWFNGIKVMFIHPDKSTPNILMVWCVDLDEVDWISILDNGHFKELKVSNSYATKFGLWSIADYK